MSYGKQGSSRVSMENPGGPSLLVFTFAATPLIVSMPFPMLTGLVIVMILADALTKPLPHPRFTLLRFKIGVSDGATILRGNIRESPTSNEITSLTTQIIPRSSAPLNERLYSSVYNHSNDPRILLPLLFFAIAVTGAAAIIVVVSCHNFSYSCLAANCYYFSLPLPLLKFAPLYSTPYPKSTFMARDDIEIGNLLFIYQEAAADAFDYFCLYAGCDCRGKIGYLSGTIPEPASDAVTYDKWVMENAIVKGWLELDHRKPITFTQADVIKVRQKEIDEKRVYLFLIGLDDIYDPIRGEILRTKPFPNPATTFATMRREEQRRNTMLNLDNASIVAMAIKKHENQSLTQHSSHGSTARKCTHCAIKSEGLMRAVTTALARRREKPQFVLLNRHLLLPAISLVVSVTSSPSRVDSALLQQLGNIGLTLLAIDSQKDHGWILDYGATNHMMFDGPSFTIIVLLLFLLLLMPTDLINGEIIGRGTKRGGLYYVDDVCGGKSLSVKGSNRTFEDQLHRATYPINSNKRFVPFALVLRSDNGGEYVNKVLHSYFQEHGILHETTCPYTPQQNDVAERKNRQILEITHQASIVPTTEPTSTATPTTDNVSAAFLSTTSLVLGPESPHADIHEAFSNQMSIVAIPSKVQDALSDSKWASAMTEEMQAFEKNQTWELVQLPEGKKLVDCRWIYIIKHKPNGSIDRYKARLVAQGFTQTYEGTVWIEAVSESLVWEILSCHEKYGYEQGNVDHTLFLKMKNEAEYRAMLKGDCELLWLKRLTGELGFPTEDTMKLYCDNQCRD
ncbi:unnamed protein product [Prunus armeniaca]